MAEEVLTLRQQAAALPKIPGVYLFKNREGEVLYVGKAISLRDRVRSYFAPDLADTRGPGLVNMVVQAVTLDHQQTGSELEALLLEARLIRQYKPKYNIRLRDDKSFSLIRIDLSQEFPGIYLSREKDLEELLAKKKRARAGEGKVSQKIDHQEFFGPYLSASSVRKALKTIRHIWPFRDCTSTKYKEYEKLGHGCIFATLGLCEAPCAAKVSVEDYRKNIDQIRAFLRGDREQLLRQVEQQMTEASANENYEMAVRFRDRLQALAHIQDVAETRKLNDARQRSDAYTYNAERDLRFECYDISNISGQYAVASMVVGILRDGKDKPVLTPADVKQRFYLDKSRYRKFRIKTVEGISDFDMLKEVLKRRLTRGKANEERWILPDLLFVDGGKGHLASALEVRLKLELTAERAPIGSVAKGPTRRRVDLYGTDFAKVPQVQTDEAWGTVAELLREEAHRFAIIYYRSQHRKALTGRDRNQL